jgi:hypothetical protein
MLKSKQYTSSDSQYRDIRTRLIRLESKLVRGFEELGVSLEVDADWLSVDDASNIVYLSTLGRSLTVVLQEMKARGATKIGKEYEVVHKGETVCMLTYNPKF